MESQSIWNRNFILLCLANLLIFVSMQMLLPTLPLYLVKIGGKSSDVGLVMGAYTIGAMLIRPTAGWLADQFNHKRIVLVGLTLMFTISILYNVAVSVAAIVSVRILHGITFGAINTVYGVMVMDSLPIRSLGEGIGYFGLTSTISMALAPMIGLWLTSKYSFQLLFILASVLIALVLLLTAASEGRVQSSERKRQPFKDIFPNLIAKESLYPSVTLLFLTVVYSADIYFIALFASSFGVTNAGLFFASVAVAMMVVRPISGRWSDKERSNTAFLIGFCTILASILLIAFSTNLLGLVIAGCFVGAGFSFCFPTLQILAVRYVPANRRGAANGTFFMAFDLGFGIGAILWGFVAGLISYKAMYLVTILPFLVSGILYFKYVATAGSSRKQAE